MIKNIILLIRPKQWIKNLFVFGAIIFAGELFQLHLLKLVILAFVTFCLTASSVYIINDIMDRQADREHPIKKNRPLASGTMQLPQALLLLLLLLTLSFFITYFFLPPLFALILLLYLVNNIFYSLRLKHVVILDVMMVASGFLLRALGGAVVINVFISPWFIISVSLLALFLAISKRKMEWQRHQESSNGQSFRKVLDHYSGDLLDKMILTSATSTLLVYILYTFNSGHSMLLVYTIPFVIYGLFRYFYIMERQGDGENPTETLLKDRALQINIFLWLATNILIFYFIPQ